MKRLLVVVLLLALPIGLLAVPDGGLLWRLEKRWQAFAVAGNDGREQARDRIDAQWLSQDELSRTILGAWRTSAAASLEDPWPIALPYAETRTVSGRFANGATTFSATFAPHLVLHIDTVAASGSLGGLIVDVFEEPADSTAAASFGPGSISERVAFDAWTQTNAPSRADVVPATLRTVRVRVQPTPGAIGRFALSLSARPALDFPVDIDTESPVRSVFGMPRDGGSREHHGIDIFAPRSTPVLAASDGVIRRTGNSTRGGLHIWQRALDDDGSSIGSLYYAHLDRIDVAAGDPVTRGMTIGAVGNTGNARTTPPHLHFGLYRRFAGPVDPLPLTGPNRRVVPPLVPGDALPEWMVPGPARANLRAGPSLESAVRGQTRNDELLAVHAIDTSGRWVRVTTGAGLQAWIARSLLEAADVDLSPWVLEIEEDLFAAPSRDAAVLTRLASGTSVQVSGRHGDATRVMTSVGLTGWVVDREGARLE